MNIMLSARSMFQTATLSIPTMQRLIDQFKKVYDENTEIAEKAKNVLDGIMNAKQPVASHTPTLTDELTQETLQASHSTGKGTNFLGKLIKGPAALFLLQI